MPAAPSSPTVPVIGHLAGFAGEAGPGLLALLAKIEDPRHRRGVRHRLVVILALAVCAVLAGARSFTAIAEWATDADEETLARLGVMGKVPAESTIRRVLQRLDVDAFDKLAGVWAAQRTAPVAGRRRVVAVNGKTLRGSGRGGQDAPHLPAALDHAHGAVLGQVEVGAKTNEVTRFSVLLDPVDIRDAVITADALHAQRDDAAYLHRCGAHYLITVKGNQPHLFAQLKTLPWRQIPIAHESRGRGHGRDEHRTIKVTSVAAGLLFPHAAQAIQIRRRRRPAGTNKWSTETSYAITSLGFTQASAAELAAIIRGHWGIEDRLHWVRSQGVLSPLHDVVLKRFTEGFCNTSAKCGARCRRCSEPCPPRTCNMRNTLNRRRRRTYPLRPARSEGTHAMSVLHAERRSVTWTSTKTAPRRAPRPGPASWPACATS